MEIPTVAIPVRCAKCGAPGLAEFPVLVVAIALVRWNNMCLYAPCHEGIWDAAEAELEAIRHHLGRDWIREHGQCVLMPHSAKVTFLERNEREVQRKISPGLATRRHGAVSGIPLLFRQARDLN